MNTISASQICLRYSEVFCPWKDLPQSSTFDRSLPVPSGRQPIGTPVMPSSYMAWITQDTDLGSADG